MMGTMRLVVETCDQGMPEEVSVDQLRALLPDKKNQLWLDIGDPGEGEVALLRGVFGDRLTLRYLSHPADAPVGTTLELSRALKGPPDAGGSRPLPDSCYRNVPGLTWYTP
jgi:hypothetical protein